MANIVLKKISVCENVIVAFNGQLSLINLISEITTKGLPAIYPKFAILTQSVGDVGSYEEVIEIVSLVDEKIVATTTGKADIKGPGGNNFIANFFNIAFPVEGRYWVKVTLAGNISTNKDDHIISVKKI